MEPTSSGTVATRGLPPLRTLTLILASGCNLRCTYCFQHPERPARMTWRVLREALDLLLASTRRTVDVVFTGGEPLLAFPLNPSSGPLHRDARARRLLGAPKRDHQRHAARPRRGPVPGAPRIHHPTQPRRRTRGAVVPRRAHLRDPRRAPRASPPGTLGVVQTAGDRQCHGPARDDSIAHRLVGTSSRRTFATSHSAPSSATSGGGAGRTSGVSRHSSRAWRERARATSAKPGVRRSACSGSRDRRPLRRPPSGCAGWAGQITWPSTSTARSLAARSWSGRISASRTRRSAGSRRAAAATSRQS